MMVRVCSRKPPSGRTCSWWSVLAKGADDSDVHSFLGAFVQGAQHLRVGNLGIVDEQLFLRPVNERAELLASVDRADDKRVQTGFVGRCDRCPLSSNFSASSTSLFFLVTMPKPRLWSMSRWVKLKDKTKSSRRSMISSLS